MDTIIGIKEVTVLGRKLERAEIGGKTTELHAKILQSTQTKSLAELLSDNSTILIKSLGQGGLSTASFRGTASVHTLVTWNGIALNSPMMGNFDFSEIPVFFVDGVKLNHGAGGLRTSTGALGGSVNLNNSLDRADRVRVKMLSEIGSNSTYTEGLHVRKSFGKFTLGSRLYYQKSANNYRYENKVLQKDPFYERRKNAQYNKTLLMQEAYYAIRENEGVQAIVWWQSDNRHLPPSIIVNYASKETLANSNLRSVIRYSKQMNNASLKINTALLSYRSTYDRLFDISLGDTTSRNKSYSWILNGEYVHKLRNNWSVGGVVNYRLDRAVSSNYERETMTKAIVSGSVFTEARLTDKLQVEAQSMWEQNRTRHALTYNLGVRYHVIDELLMVKASNAYNHRFPTLNDLYWNPGGNVNLKPERGMSSDVTLRVTPKGRLWDMQGEVTYYHMDIKDWIMWIPTGTGYIWMPANFSKVRSTGLELGIVFGLRYGTTRSKLHLNYGYALSVDKSGRNDPTHNKQLPYIPRHKWNARYSLDVSAFNFIYNIMFTDMRYTAADQSYSTNAYTIHHAQMNYVLSKGQYLGLKLTLRADNLLNTYYESTHYYPMPLRTLSAGIELTL
jgi:iron complex outermembrane receptor protein